MTRRIPSRRAPKFEGGTRREIPRYALSLLETPTDPAFILDAEGTVLKANHAALGGARDSQAPPREPDSTLLRWIKKPQDLPRILDGIGKVLKTGHPQLIENLKGGPFFQEGIALEMTLLPIFEPKGPCLALGVLKIAREDKHLGKLRDLQRQVHERTVESIISLNLMEDQQRQLITMETNLRASEARYRNLFEASKDAVYITSQDGRILDMNQAALDLFGLSPEAISTMNVGDLYADPAAGDRVLQCLESEGFVKDHEVDLRTKDGRILSCLLTGSVRADSNGVRIGTQGIIRDVTDRKALEDQLRRGAFEDALTGLANKALFLDRLGHALELSRRIGMRFAVYLLDLDHFQVIDHSLGPEVGDELLVLVGRRLQLSLRSSDTLARLGSDEFALLVEDLPELADATQLAESLLYDLKEPCSVREKLLYVSASVGIVYVQSGYLHPEDILRDADTAMHRAKALGRGTHAVYAESMHADSLARLNLETDLRQAVRGENFLIHYQPIVHLETGLPAGVEALVRWMHPQQGLRLPGEFIRLAEETGLIGAIGSWVLESSCGDMRRWQEGGGKGGDLFLSVNLSARQFSWPGLVREVRGVLENSGLSPGRLMLEVTESMIMEDADHAGKVLYKLKDLGVKLMIDDFGTGYSSLSALHRYPIDIMKIDRSFVARMDTDRECFEIVSTILKLAKSLNLEVVAEGIETRHQWDLLKHKRCAYGQGFFFARPLPESELLRFLVDENPPGSASDLPPR